MSEHVITLRRRLGGLSMTVMTRRESPPKRPDLVVFKDLDPALRVLARMRILVPIPRKGNGVVDI